MVCNLQNVFLKDGACPSLSSFLLPTEWNVGLMAAVRAAILDYEIEAVHLRTVEQQY